MKIQIKPLLVITFVLMTNNALAQQLTLHQAAAVYDRIRTTPAQLTIYCERQKANQELMSALTAKDKDKDASAKAQRRVTELEAKLPDFNKANQYFATNAPKGVKFFSEGEGKPVHEATRKLNSACYATK